MTTPAPAKIEKPYPEFPLTAHRASGQWCRKFHGRTVYFGKLADHEAALAKYVYQRDDLQAGRKPKPFPPEVTSGTTPETTPEDDQPRVHHLVNRFLISKQQAVQGRELAQRTFDQYERSAKAFAAYFNPERSLADLDAQDFEKFRAHLAKGRSLVSLSNEIRVIKIMFNFGWTHLIEPEHLVRATPLRLKDWLKAPKKTSLRIERAAKPVRMLEADQLRELLAAAGVQLRAQILLGVNCGFGNRDIALLPESAVDLKSGWIEFPRPKTGIERRLPLWPETVEVIRAAVAKRPQPKHAEAVGKVFVTKYGAVYVRSRDGMQVDAVALEFWKLLTRLGFKKPGINFYALRSVIETIGGSLADQIAVDSLMGHVPSSNDMGSVYRKKLNDDRLKAVTEHVRGWLWPGGSEAAWLKAEAAREKRASKRKP